MQATRQRYLGLTAAVCAFLIAFTAATPVIVGRAFRSYESNGDASAEGNCTLNTTVPSTGLLLSQVRGGGATLM